MAAGGDAEIVVIRNLTAQDVARSVESVAAKILEARGAELDSLKSAVIEIAGSGSHSNVSAADMTPRTKHIIEVSSMEALQLRQNYIGTEHLLLALLSERDCVGASLLEANGVSLSDVRNDISSYLGSGRGEGASSTGERKDNSQKASASNTPTLNNHGRDLTALAKEGKIDPIIGRDSETERVV